ncbi:transcription antitermination factor NusB [Acinetobacter nectaris]|uniref:Transcription antitermination protein NusB n=1 Tax=Acinetobacter nectaris CIP 110549 TaxID=1392540 RepID=V2TRX4_9GAMM|nr:transcription antitermination factor NusB [Acinetobacter nectaris]ESK38815.1 transcription antitermination factor NusB [Acinetobacter nectaris CIP 110549]MCF8998337.1 transcription antitermination factor NusB [Acinetobacter nectaris]MCF9027811.1 transcription antitermination factor NusB [Acinetobacter nectaris]MCF9033669.1 transcription antitermination factor NusB [Acinetobacter nectaris]
MSQTQQAIYAAKRKARRFAVQGIYEWQMSQNPVHEIEARTRADNAMHKVDLNYYHELLTRVIAEREVLDELLKSVLDRELTALDGVELATLRLGAYELRDHAEIPYRVVLDEAIELAKHFGGADSHKYINGVLDRLAQTLRQAEKQA